MSVMAAHIRVLRAEAKALDALAAEYESLGAGTVRATAIIIFRGFATTKRVAADALEAEEPKLREETPVNYNPKGKR